MMRKSVKPDIKIKINARQIRRMLLFILLILFVFNLAHFNLKADVRNSAVKENLKLCGLKGTACGGAEVSTKHSGFVINKDNATFDDVMGVVDIVKQKVKEHTGVMLECEVLIMK